MSCFGQFLHVYRRSICGNDKLDEDRDKLVEIKFDKLDEVRHVTHEFIIY